MAKAARYRPASNDDAIGWATKLRNKNLPPSPEESKLLKRFEKDTPPPVDGYYPDLALVGGVPAGTVIEKLLAAEKAEVRLAAAETCARGIFSESAMEALAKRMQDSSPKVRRGSRFNDRHGRSCLRHSRGKGCRHRSGTCLAPLIAEAQEPEGEPGLLFTREVAIGPLNKGRRNHGSEYGISTMRA